MAVTTSVKKSFVRWMFIMGAACLVIGLWGLYDFAVKLPREQRRAEDFFQVQQRMVELQELRVQREATGGAMTDEEILEYRALEQRMSELAPSGENPVPPSKFDWVFQVACMLCLPFVPYFYLQYRRNKGRVYRLDDDGTLHLPAPHGAWKADDIADIDMSRWMRKSIAEVVHRDGTRVKLDDYIHQDTEKIVGALAHRFHPGAWTEQAKPVKSDAKATDEAPEPAAGDGGTDDAPDKAT